MVINFTEFCFLLCLNTYIYIVNKKPADFSQVTGSFYTVTTNN